jgi:hypothetical protein
VKSADTYSLILRLNFRRITDSDRNHRKGQNLHNIQISEADAGHIHGTADTAKDSLFRLSATERGVSAPGFGKIRLPGSDCAKKQEWEYHKAYAQFDRRAKWRDLLSKKGIHYVDHTMVMDVIEQNGRIVGALGLHIPSGALITFKVTAVIMCMGCVSPYSGLHGVKLCAEPSTGAYVLSFEERWS